MRYSNHQLLIRENCAEHAANTTLIAILIGTSFNLLSGKKLVCLKEISYRGIIHDVGEGYTCDVVTSVKKAIPELNALLNKLEHDRMASDVESGNITAEFLRDVEDAKNYEILEGLIIGLADRLDALRKIDFEYHAQARVTLESLYLEVIENVDHYVQKMIKSSLLADESQVLEHLRIMSKELKYKHTHDRICRLNPPDFSDSPAGYAPQHQSTVGDKK